VHCLRRLAAAKLDTLFCVHTQISSHNVFVWLLSHSVGGRGAMFVPTFRLLPSRSFHLHRAAVGDNLAPAALTIFNVSKRICRIKHLKDGIVFDTAVQAVRSIPSQ
jgi:hypothetical protein